jgi:hypothetical protein
LVRPHSDRKRSPQEMKALGYLVALALLLLVIFQRWTYSYRGFDFVTIAVAGGEVNFDLSDQARSKGNTSYCLFSSFRTNDKAGEPVAIRIDRVGTRSIPEIRKDIVNSGKTFSIDGQGDSPSYFEPPGISDLILPADEPLEVIGSIQYKGVSHGFQISLKLRHWERSRKVIKFCV